MNKLYSLIFLIIMISCLSEQAQITNNQQTSANISNNTDPSVNENYTTVFSEKINWLNSGLSSQSVTLNINNSKNVFLVGDEIHNYLSKDENGDGIKENFNSIYCVEIRFPQTANSKPLRLRAKAIPDSSDNFKQNQTTRYLRVNLSSSAGNDFCLKKSEELSNGQIVVIDALDSNYDGIINGNDIAISLNTEGICSNCSNIIESNLVTLYQHNSNTDYLYRVDTSFVSYPDLRFRVDINSNSDTGSNSCTDSQCVSEGFECCVQGQCVNEKNKKMSGISNDPDGFAIAELEKYTDPNWFKKYPQFYYICLEQQPEDDDEAPTDPNEPSDPIGDADQRLEALIKEYECIEELKTNSETDPFHTSPINSSSTYTKCEITDVNSEIYFETVMKKLYQNCGCDERNNLSIMVSSCPKYTYAPVYLTDNNGNETTTITSISCVTPAVAQTPLPFQNLELAVNSRSAPHRFFDDKNVEIYSNEELPSNSSGVQEGEEFKYLDDFKLFPKNGEYNMNSILGQMTTSLNQARPAVKVDLEFDKQYIISTLSGMATLCPTCSKDSWYSNFTATPYSTQGVGVRAIGFTTRRDTYGSNTTLANYEDNIFGRACWVPPTMIPFSHEPNADTQTQRLNRLQTQAALFINGYQRDWYGFNKGALIGSFDGVTWFAVGKGRIVKSTSTKLFLAINAPFADLTSPSDHIVSVQEYDFSATAAVYDYAPDLETNDSGQNEAGSCQEYHECEVDSHCITKLGWEYVCADVNYNKTKWPIFNPDDALEVSSGEKIGSITEFLQQQTLPPGAGTKRCVYRGAGSPCRIDYDNITDDGLRKNLACAPNFYCAQLNSNDAFNKEIARFARPLDELLDSKNHYYGHDADFIGRPKNYISTSSLTSLPTNVIDTIERNVLLTDSSAAGNVGICRPGKSLPDYASSTQTQNWNPIEQQKTADPLYRTDFISQISGCNSSLYTDLRYSSCPILDDEGNYLHLQNDFLDDIITIDDVNTTITKQEATERFSFAQNSCGLESLDSNAIIGIGNDSDSISNFSAFKTIEAPPLNTSNVIIEKTLAKDACLRKPGAVCHTDLDCSPNRLMASVIDLVPISFFGNEAEKKYYDEYLVCGQAQQEPNIGSENYDSYTLHNNRCCRPVGESITMFTENSQYAVESQGIQTNLYGGLNANNPSRYSRFAVVPSNINSSTLESNIIRPSADTTDLNNDKILDNTVNITNLNQWISIHEAASRTCCGSGWVRKFADGTNDWSRKRLNLNPNNFSCINYRSPLLLTENNEAFGLTPGQLNSGKSKLCMDPSQTARGCIQQEIGDISDLTIRRPVINTMIAPMTIHSDINIMTDEWVNNLWAFNLFTPLDNVSGVNDDRFILDWDREKTPSDPTADDDVLRENFITTLPTSIPTSSVNSSVFDIDGDTIDDILIATEDPGQPDNTYVNCTRIIPPNYDCSDPNGFYGICDAKSGWTAAGAAACTSTCCYMYDESNRKLVIAHNNTIKQSDSSYDNNEIGMRVTYYAPGTLAWETRLIDSLPVEDETQLVHRRSSTPGNAMYYLKRLAKLEYLGIPQISYDPIYCNDNYQNLVPGVFKEEVDGDPIKTVNDFINHKKTYINSNSDIPWSNDSAVAPYNADSLNINLSATQELIDHNQIFSDNEFKCCIELMGSTNSAAACCSGFAVDEDGNASSTSQAESFTCKLPPKTNLNVYFNKFVSGDGLKGSIGTSPLETSDFDSETGEPQTDITVLRKLTAIGEIVCQNGVVRRGGIFGSFQGEPVSNQGQFGNGNGSSEIFSIVDSLYDSGQSNNTPVGRQQFNEGFIWNHHIYCE